MNRQLATIQIVKEIVDVAGTDNLQIATVLGWHVIINRNAGICIGDPVVYVEVDSQLPDKPEFEFLRKYGFKIKTMKMRGVVSQGIIFKMDDVGIDLLTHNVGDDVTEELEIIQFNEPAIPKFVGGKTIEKRNTVLIGYQIKRCDSCTNTASGRTTC